MEITNTQVEVLCNILSQADYLGYGADYEITDYTVEVIGNEVLVELSTGKKDAKTFIERHYLSEYVQLYIGKRGGVTYLVGNNKGGVVMKRAKYPLNIYGIALEQKGY